MPRILLRQKKDMRQIVMIPTATFRSHARRRAHLQNAFGLDPFVVGQT